MNFGFIVLVLYALLSAQEVLAAAERNNDAIHQNKVTIPIELIRAMEEAEHNQAVPYEAVVQSQAIALEPKKPVLSDKQDLTASEREARLLRRLYRISDFRQENELVGDPEDLGRAVRKRQRKRVRNTYGIDPMRSQKRKSTSRKGNKKSKTKKTKKGGNRKLQNSAGVRRGTNNKRKSNKHKKVKKPVKKPEPVEEEPQNDDIDGSYEEEIHKLQMAPGEPLRLMIVEDDY